MLGPLGGLLGGGGGGGGGKKGITSEDIANWLADPETRKSLAAMVGSGGKFMEDIMNAPPHVQAMMKQVSGGGTNQVGGQGPTTDMMNPYGGDMAKFITPEMARGVLDAHGIPYGRIRSLK